MIESTQKGAVTTVQTELADKEEGQWVFITSDLHIDSISANRKYLIEDLDLAKARNATILLVGDTFDAMQGRFDPRRNMDELRPEYRRQDYYDFAVQDVAGILEPYAENLLLVADGNHELGVLKNSNTNLTDRLVSMINYRTGAHVVHAGYGGYVRWMLKSKGRGLTSVLLKYYHGAGGEAPVTRGVIQTNRQAVYLPDAQIVVNGHNHNQYYVTIARERVNQAGQIFFDTQHHVRTPGYKQDYGDGSAGWDVTRGGVPKPLGGVFVNLSYKIYASDKSGRKPPDRAMIACYPLIHEPEPVSMVAGLYTGTEFPME